MEFTPNSSASAPAQASGIPVQAGLGHLATGPVGAWDESLAASAAVSAFASEASLSRTAVSTPSVVTARSPLLSLEVRFTAGEVTRLFRPLWPRDQGLLGTTRRMVFTTPLLLPFTLTLGHRVIGPSGGMAPLCTAFPAAPG